MNALLLSINPEHVVNIMNHSKLFEFRKVACKKKVDIMIIYCTNPVKKIVGQAKIGRIITGDPEHVWRETESGAGISKEFFDKYYFGKKTAIAYELCDIVKYNEPRNLSDFGICSPPQSFVYVDWQWTEMANIA